MISLKCPGCKKISKVEDKCGGGPTVMVNCPACGRTQLVSSCYRCKGLVPPSELTFMPYQLGGTCGGAYCESCASAKDSEGAAQFVLLAAIAAVFGVVGLAVIALLRFLFG